MQAFFKLSCWYRTFFYLSTFGGICNHPTNSVLASFGETQAPDQPAQLPGMQGHVLRGGNEAHISHASVEDPLPYWCLYDIDIEPTNSVGTSITDRSEGYYIMPIWKLYDKGLGPIHRDIWNSIDLQGQVRVYAYSWRDSARHSTAIQTFLHFDRQRNDS